MFYLDTKSLALPWQYKCACLQGTFIVNKTKQNKTHLPKYVQLVQYPMLCGIGNNCSSGTVRIDEIHLGKLLYILFIQQMNMFM